MKTQEELQRRHVSLLCVELAEFGISTVAEDCDSCEPLTESLLLDALACAGLRLIVDRSGVASAAFMEEHL